MLAVLAVDQAPVQPAAKCILVYFDELTASSLTSSDRLPGLDTLASEAICGTLALRSTGESPRDAFVGSLLLLDCSQVM